MLEPKKPKWRKAQKVLPRRKYTKRGDQIAFGSFAIKAVTPGRITARQIEAARIAITRFMKREGKVWIRIFPDRPVTRKPAEVRMGKGKGSLEYWATPVEPGRILFEADGVPLETAKEALRLAAQKLPVVVKFVVRHDYTN
jgi:large subunit ribosomal protein L16